MNLKKALLIGAGAIMAVTVLTGCGGDNNGTNNGTGPGPRPGEESNEDHFNPKINYGSFTDQRDGKTYRTTVMMGDTWMAENLKYNVSGSVCFGEGGRVIDSVEGGGTFIISTKTLSATEIQSNCAKYGRLYDWPTAMGGATTGSSAVPSGVQGVCPDRWHLPSDAEWTRLKDGIGSSYNGRHLKSLTGWKESSEYGLDSYGFSALPGGYSLDLFRKVGEKGYWWSATEGSNSSFAAHAASLSYNGTVLVDGIEYIEQKFSVRCVQDK